MVIPWFAVLFIVVAGVNSLHLLPSNMGYITEYLGHFLTDDGDVCFGDGDTFSKFKGIGSKAIALALILFVWLVLEGFGL